MENSEKCPKCGSEDIVPIASNWLSQRKDLPLYYCKECRYEWGRDEMQQKINN